MVHFCNVIKISLRMFFERGYFGEMVQNVPLNKHIYSSKLNIQYLLAHVFLGIFFWSHSGNHPSVERCTKIGYCPQEDLAKYGYKSNLKYTSLITFLCSRLQTGNQIQGTGNFFIFLFSHFWGLKTLKNTSFLNFLFFISLLGKISPVLRRRLVLLAQPYLPNPVCRGFVQQQQEEKFHTP